MANTYETDFSYAIQALSDLSAQAVAQLRSPHTREAWLQKKIEIEHAVAVLSQAARLGLSGREESWTMPDCRTPTPSSEYRVVEDNETEQREYWTEVSIDGKRVRLLPGDIVLRRR